MLLNPFEHMETEPLIKEYKGTIHEFLGQKKIEELPHIQDFFKMKDCTKMPDKEDIRYMDINKREYQNRKKPLPRIKELIKNK